MYIPYMVESNTSLFKYYVSFYIIIRNVIQMALFECSDLSLVTANKLHKITWFPQRLGKVFQIRNPT